MNYWTSQKLEPKILYYLYESWSQCFEWSTVNLLQAEYSFIYLYQCFYAFLSSLAQVFTFFPSCQHVVVYMQSTKSAAGMWHVLLISSLVLPVLNQLRTFSIFLKKNFRCNTLNLETLKWLPLKRFGKLYVLMETIRKKWKWYTFPEVITA